MYKESQELVKKLQNDISDLAIKHSKELATSTSEADKLKKLLAES